MFDFSQLTAFHLLRPWWLLALIPLLLSIYYLRRARDPLAQWKGVLAPHLLQALTVNDLRATWFNPINLSGVVVFLGVLALSGPSWERKALPFVEDEAPLVIALDLSETMNAKDVQPSRLERAKQKIHDLVVLRSGSPTALLAYAGTAHSVVPLTNDPDLYFQFLSAVVTEMMPVEGKLPEKALPAFERILGQTKLPATLLLVTDGVSASSYKEFPEFFSDSIHQLLVLGVGGDQGDLDAQTEEFSAFEAGALETLAEASGGSYQSLSFDSSDVERLNRKIDRHLQTVEDENRPWVDAGYYLIYPLALCFLFWFRKGWTLQWCLVLSISAFSYTPKLSAEPASSPVSSSATSSSASLADNGDTMNEQLEEHNDELGVFEKAWDSFLSLWLTPDQMGRYYFERGEFIAASRHFNQIAWKASAFYYAEKFETAAELYSRIDTTQGLFNLANAQAQGKAYVKAINTYSRVLERDPLHEGAEKNRSMVQSIVDQINAMSASQQPEAGEASSELGDEPQRADGAEKQELLEFAPQQLTADQLLADEKLQEQWMKQVQQDPSRFLRIKFQMQNDLERVD
jgi:Ca-activated chloride channel homolog